MRSKTHRTILSFFWRNPPVSMRIPLPAIKRKARIEIIPLIDIVFFLLATFVMVSLSMVKNQGINLNLPKATTGTVQEQKASAIVSVSQSGDIYLNKEKVGFDGLTKKLTGLKQRDPELRVIIQADKDVNFGNAIQIMDEVRRLGITKLAVQTRGKDT